MGGKESKVTLPKEVVPEPGGEDGRDVPIVPVEIQVLILSHADSVTLVGSVQVVCKAWRDVASKFLRDRQTYVVLLAGLVPPVKTADETVPELLEPSAALLQWDRQAVERSYRDGGNQTSTRLIVSIQEGAEKPKNAEMMLKGKSRLWTGQEIYRGDIFQEFCNEANTTEFPRSFKCSDQVNRQALQELIKLMVLASGPTIRQEWLPWHRGCGASNDLRWTCSFYFTLNSTASSWTSAWGSNNLSDKGQETLKMTLRFQFQQYISLLY